MCCAACNKNQWSMNLFSQISFSIHHRNSANETFVVFMGMRNVSIDWCKYVNGVGGSLLADALVKASEQNIIQPCPQRVSIAQALKLTNSNSRAWILCIFVHFQDNLYMRIDLNKLSFPTLMRGGQYAIHFYEIGMVNDRIRDWIHRVEMVFELRSKSFITGWIIIIICAHLSVKNI